MNEQSMMLINMPWCMVHRPSIQLGTLESVLTRAGIMTQVRSFNLAFVDCMAGASLPEGERLSFEDYLEVAENYYHLGLGDWIFAVEPFTTPGERDAEYLAYFRSKDGSEEVIAKALRMRELVPAFLEACVEDVMRSAPRIVGFTTTFSQNVPSLVLAKLLKARDPSLRIVFGGSNCDGPMGNALHRAFPWVDVVVRGRAERILPELVRDLCGSGSVRPQPGLCYRQGTRRVVVEQSNEADVPMDEVPLPDYDEYFERLERSRSRPKILQHLTIPFESARGCWWGEKKHCTFCGLNGSTMAFSSKSPALVVEELLTLARKHKWLNFNAVDNIIDMRYFRDMLPALRDSNFDFTLFYETKSNLKREHLRAMREAGVAQIQPGIESLSTPILRLMDKGVTALQNIRLLKWCAEFDVHPGWNVIYAFPGEPAEEYERMAELMKSLTHLAPPENLHALDLERFSPYHQRPRAYGLRIRGAKQYYRLIYPCDEAALNDLAYTFDFAYDDGRQPDAYVASVKESIDQWRKDFNEGSNLSYQRGPGFLLIKDRRPGLGGYNYSLRETEAKIYLGCDHGATPGALWKSLAAGGETEISLEDVEEFLDEMTEMKLMYEEDGLYLSLAVAASPQMKSTIVEAEEARAAQGPAFVKLSRQVIEEFPVI